jgi:hypothetical protein
MKKQGSGVRGQGSGKTEDQPTITAHTVKAALWELGESSSAAVADHLKVKTFKDRFKVKQILAALVRTGGAEIGGPLGVTTYRLTDKPGRGAVQAKLWEFACLRFATAKPFTAAEAARLAECDRDYTKRYCRWLWGAGYLAIAARGRAGALLYQVVGGKEHEAAPPWNRRAEKRKRVGQAPSPAVLPEIPPSPPLEKGGDEEHRLKTGATRLDAALEDFGRALVEVAGGIGRAWEIIREMKGELLAMEGHGHDEPGEPTAGHH